jgi:serine/threonine protein kinase
LIQSLGAGTISQVYLGQRLGLLPFLATIKLSSVTSAADRYAREAQVLRELRGLDAGAAEIFLPLVLAHGVVQDHQSKHGLVLRHPSGFWGSLAALNESFPEGLDPRHAVWIWRRLLAVLAFIHRHGWRHGDVRPEHALVHPGDHGVRLIGWASAEKGVDARDQATDLVRSACVVLVLLCGEKEADAVPDHVPVELAQLVTLTSQDEAFCRAQRAEGLDGLLRAAARSAFGPPTFVPLIV